jgi:hypothetical protein
VSIDREAIAALVEHGDNGRHVVFADVTRQKTTARVLQSLTREDLTGPALGDQQLLKVVTSPSPGDAWRRELRATCVVTGVLHTVEVGRPAVRVIDLVAVSTAGNVDPVTVVDVGVNQ